MRILTGRYAKYFVRWEQIRPALPCPVLDTTVKEGESL